MSAGIGQNIRRLPDANQPALPSKYPRKRSHSVNGSAQRFLVLSCRLVPLGFNKAYPFADCGLKSCTNGHEHTKSRLPLNPSQIFASHFSRRIFAKLEI